MNEINFEIKDAETINLAMDVGIKEIYPPIENLEVTPTKQKQTFTHENSYGYDNVTVESIPDEYIIPDGTLEVGSNGDVDVTMFRMARVGVYTPPNLQDKEVTPTKNIQTVVADEGFDGLNNVVVNPIPNEYIVPNLQNKSITITENGTQTITPDENYTGLNSVEVIANIGGSNENTTIQFYEAYSKFYDSLSPQYNKTYDTNENVTLYTPATGYTNYFIVYRGGGYAIFWTPNGRPIGYFTSRYFYPIAIFYIPQISLYTSGVKNNKISSYADLITVNTSNSGLTFYMSSLYNTIEECIEAMKSSTTTYSSLTSNKITATAYNNTSTPVVMTNSLELGVTELINECGRQLSSNEIVEVIPTE